MRVPDRDLLHGQVRMQRISQSCGPGRPSQRTRGIQKCCYLQYVWILESQTIVIYIVFGLLDPNVLLFSIFLSIEPLSWSEGQQRSAEPVSRRDAARRRPERPGSHAAVQGGGRAARRLGMQLGSQTARQPGNQAENKQNK